MNKKSLKNNDEHTHSWVLKEERSHFSATIRLYTCECGEEKETYQIWGLQEVDL